MTTIETAPPRFTEVRADRLIARIMRAIDALPEAERYACTSRIAHAALNKCTPAAIQSLSTLLPRIKRITWEIEYSHDDAGGMFSSLECITLINTDGAEVTLGSHDEDFYAEFVWSVRVPGQLDPTQSSDPCLRGLANVAQFGHCDGEEGEQNTCYDEAMASVMKLLAEFTGGDPDTMAETLAMLEEATFATFTNSQERVYELR